MIIENPDQFKAWLTAVLEPLCDADPEALAKYVYALVKKDKTLDELRGGMVEQLDVFLQHETKNFVELLFKTLETQKYVLPPPKVEPLDGNTPPGVNQPPQLIPPEKVVVDTAIPSVTNLTPILTNPTLSIQLNGSTAVPIITKRETRKSESEKDDKEKRPRSRGRMRSRTRSRSRSWERDRRRSRSREHIRRDRERDRSRPWRNKSPPSAVRRHERRRSRSRSTSPLRARTRDVAESRDHRTRFRNRSPSPLRSRSRSRSPDRKAKIDRSERLGVDVGRIERVDASPGGTPTQDSNHGDIDMRLSTTSQSIQSVVAVASNIPNNQTGPFPPKRRCRDFDEKGYCMRGDLCPYDHGTDPVVLEDVALSRVLTFGPHGAQAPGTVPVTAVPEPPPGHNGNAPPPHLPLASLPPPHLRNQHHSNMGAFAEYNPDAPSMEPRLPWGRHTQPGSGIYGRGQRELISVPVIPHSNLPEMTHPQSNPLKRKQTFDFNRLGPKQRTIHNPANCSLELKKVPRVLNNITQLNNHFSKFGKIVNIQVNFGGDPEAALVTFQLPNEAKAAYRSTEAVLNNRFIKVFWHNNITNNTGGVAIENVPPGSRPSVKERLGAAISLPSKIEENEYVPTRRSSDELQQQQQQPLQQPQQLPQQQPQQHHQVTQNIVSASTKIVQAIPTREDKVNAIKKTQEILAAKETLKKKQEEKRKEAIKLTADLRKRKQELLDKHLTEIRTLIDKAEKNPEQKDAIMATIKVIQPSIDELRKDLATNGQPGNNKTQVKSREQTQKEILDAELDLMTAQQEGQDAGELQKRLVELKAQAATLGLTTNAPVPRVVKTTRVVRGGHTLAYRGRGRGGFTHVSVDHRPTSLLISGYETEEKAEVLAHFQQYGEIINQIVDDATPSIVINYKSRKEAEVAMVKGRTFQDRLLSITWVSGHHLHRGIAGSGLGANSNAVVSARSEQAQITDEEIDLEGAGEALYLEENEEEEDEDGEPRSWRR